MNRGDLFSIRADRHMIKHEMLDHNPTWQLPKTQTWRAAYDIIVDWISILASTWALYRIGWVIAPLALLVVGNRQRALGNLLHEASHGNLSLNRHFNDYLAYLVLAAPLLNSLAIYRNLHARHHAWLGDAQDDPDLLPPLAREGDGWFHVYIRYLTKFSLILGSLTGHLMTSPWRPRHQLYIVAWWAAVMSILLAANIHFTGVFLALWFGARITVFHAITTFREMTDHYALKPGGIFSFTREIPDNGVLSTLIHPHHNGYHLTHHLFPAVPYHQLPELHAQLMTLSAFRERAIVCPAYVDGFQSSVSGWGANHG
ncbi:fatty acid desaturase [Burkholderia multivorans]|uniref:fatty acid desaturase n=1 Tax=Burkholderia multivorans TaxID=87883 RepID=UPI0009BEBF83|nr:fatty acid desaturase [Burkholderia multivorans]PRG73465.1 fatty acid desaturase [Burkholderia multivorans]